MVQPRPAAVAAFFIVSGFVIPYSLERVNSLRIFWTSRFFRLYPLYWFSLLIVFICVLGGVDVMRPEAMAEWKTVLLVNITMLQELLPPVVCRFIGNSDHIAPAIEPYWTLMPELVFYILFSLFFALRVNKRTLSLAWIGLVVLVASAAADATIHKKFPVGHIALLSQALLGTAVFRYYTGAVSRRQLSLLALGAIVAFAAAFGLGFSSLRNTAESTDTWTSFAMFTSYAAGAVLFGMVFLLRDAEFPFALRWLGMISYSLYLLHFPCLVLLTRIPHGGPVSAPLWALLVITVSCLVSSATYLLIEKPAVDMGKRLLGKPKPATELDRPTRAFTPVGSVSVVTRG